MRVGDCICHWHLKTAATRLPSFVVTVSGIYSCLQLCFPAATEKYGPMFYFVPNRLWPQVIRVHLRLPITDQCICNPTFMCKFETCTLLFSVREEDKSVVYTQFRCRNLPHCRVCVCVCAFMFYICSLGLVI